MKRFASREEMKPLLWLCYAGKLFDVQTWIAAGKPVNPPLPEPKKRRWPGPLEEAIDMGFHSLVQVLLEGGANLTEPHNEPYEGFCALTLAARKQRMDIMEMLVKHGADPRRVSMWYVFNTWDSDIMSFFIERGADVTTDNPLARAFELKIRPALGIYKKYEAQFDDWKRQINIALRYHTRQQNQRWVALLLWAGADPYDIGPEDSEETCDYGNCALELAIRFQWEWMVEKVNKFKPTRKAAFGLLLAALESRQADVIQKLVDAGSVGMLTYETAARLLDHYIFYTSVKQPDSTDLRIAEILFQNGLKWRPEFSDIPSQRRRLLQFGYPGFREFIHLIQKYDAATEQVLHELTRTGTAQALLD